MTNERSGGNVAENTFVGSAGGYYQLPRKVDETGRSTSTPASRRIRKAMRTSDGETFAKLPTDVLESPSFQVICSSAAMRVLMRILIEHQREGGKENGRLVVTRNDFETYGVERKRVTSAIAQLVALGLVAHVDRGRRAWGEDKGRPATFEITWFPVFTRDGTTPARRGWERYSTYEQAKSAFDNAARAKASKKTGKLRHADLRIVSSAA